MELVNQTPVVASAFLSELEGLPFRLGQIVAKATFTFDESGRPQLDTETPVDLMPMDKVTDDGVIPADLMPRRTDMLELCIVGAAYGGRGRFVPSTVAAFEIDGIRREMLVFGERVWEGSGRRATVSAPVPFDRMPLTWSRTYGGQADVYVDAKNSIPVAHEYNPIGKGFDAVPYLTAIERELGAAPGFPQLLPTYRRLLPNFENPLQPIREWQDAPDPWCFSAVPAEVPYRVKPLIDAQRGRSFTDAQNATPQNLVELLAPEREGEWDAMFAKAHPALRFAPLRPNAAIKLEKLTPDGTPKFWQIPQIRLLADYVFNGRSGTQELVPQMLVLFPDTGKATLTYRSSFKGAPDGGIERSFRLRTDAGWYTRT